MMVVLTMVLYIKSVMQLIMWWGHIRINMFKVGMFVVQSWKVHIFRVRMLRVIMELDKAIVIRILVTMNILVPISMSPVQITIVIVVDIMFGKPLIFKNYQ